MREEVKVLYLKQACKDIEEHAEEIIGSTKWNKSLEISIIFDETEEYTTPCIRINKEFFVTFSDDIYREVMTGGWDDEV